MSLLLVQQGWAKPNRNIKKFRSVRVCWVSDFNICFTKTEYKNFVGFVSVRFGFLRNIKNSPTEPIISFRSLTFVKCYYDAKFTKYFHLQIVLFPIYLKFCYFCKRIINQTSTTQDKIMIPNFFYKLSYGIQTYLI